jgi:hypothetical protein
MERFRDQRNDTDNDNYQRLLAEFDPMAPNARTARDLQTAVYSESDVSSRAMLALWQDPGRPT